MSQEDKPCSQHPNAPHGFDRNASHNVGRYVCECEGWESVAAQEPVAKVLGVLMTSGRSDEYSMEFYKPLEVGALLYANAAPCARCTGIQSELSIWAKSALPPNADHLAKLREEVSELIDSPSDAGEIGDVCLALMLHASRHGIDVLHAARDKFEIVKTRKYGPCDASGVSRHIEQPPCINAYVAEGCEKFPEPEGIAVLNRQLVTSLEKQVTFQAKITEQAALIKALEAEAADRESFLKTLADLRAKLEKAEKDAERYAYILDCDYRSAKHYLPDLDEKSFKEKRTQAHDAAIAKERT